MTSAAIPATIRQVRERSVDALARAGIAEPQVDADLLIGHMLGVSRGRVQALVVTDAVVDAHEAASIDALVARRAAREPLQHITGRAPFRSLDLAVGPGVFVPRPETEMVAQLAIDALLAVAAPAPVAVDLGTGSGAIALAMATEVPHALVHAVENSPEAFAWATRNVAEAGVSNLRLILGDLADALGEIDGTVSVVISNPPYIPAVAVPREVEVRLFDPPQALYGGEDGLDVVRAVSRAALRLTRPGGVVVLEHGELQGSAIRALLSAAGWHAASTHRDFTGRDRATTALR